MHSRLSHQKKGFSFFLAVVLALGAFLPVGVLPKAEAAYAEDLFFSEYIEGSSNIEPPGDGDEEEPPGDGEEPPVEEEVTSIDQVDEVDENGVPIHLNETFTVEGIASVGHGVLHATQTNFYVQDETGGINVFNFSALNPDVQAGDRVRVTGTVTQYNGLTELQAQTAEDIEILESGQPLPEPEEVTIADLNNFETAEPLEGTLVRVTAEVTDIPGSSAGGGYNVTIADGSQSATLRVMTTTGIDVAGMLQVGITYSFTGIVGQYDVSSPYTEGYQVFPRNAGDIQEAGQVLRVVSAAPVSPTGVEVTFNLPIGEVAGVTDPANYSIVPELAVTDVALLASGGGTKVKLTTAAQAPLKPYTLTVNLEGLEGENHSADFTGFPQFGSYHGPVKVYHGDLHIHTGHSQDGSGDPADVLDAGKANGFDFIGLSDHSYAITDSEWEYQRELTKDVNEGGKNEDGTFVVVRGFEYTHGQNGHINVFNTDAHAIRKTLSESPGVTERYAVSTPTLESFYEWLATQPQAIAEFNHPAWMNFKDFVYHPEVEEMMQLLEVGNGFEQSYVYAEDYYIRALDYGWKVGATNNSDYHGNLGTDYYGTITTHRTGVLLPEDADGVPGLTQQNLLDAIKAMRTFASEDVNFEVTMKANGQWMGAVLENTGHVNFEVTYNDPDGEGIERLDLVGDKGQVLETTIPEGASGTWTPSVEIGEGVYYFYIRVIEEDGDRIVTSPVWTYGSEDVSVTDLKVEPALPSTQSVSTVTVRLTNRGQSDAQDVTVKLIAGGQEVDQQVVDLPAMSEVLSGDTLVSFTWQPQSAGPQNVRVELDNVVPGDNLTDNFGETRVEVTDEPVSLVMVDAANANFNTDQDQIQPFMDDLAAKGYNVVKNLQELSSEGLQGVEVLLIMPPVSEERQYSEAEIQAIVQYVQNGGNLWMAGISDYDDGDANQELNAILEAIGETIGSINARFNDDEVVDGNDNNGYPWGVTWHVFPAAEETGVGVNVEAATSWSEASLIDINGEALTEEDGITLLVTGDLDGGETDGTPNATHNIEADNNYQIENDAYLYTPWEDGIPVPMVAGQELVNGSRIVLWGSAHDTFDSWAYKEDDGKANELLNIQTLRWLTGDPIQQMDIAEVRNTDGEGNLVHDRKMVQIQGSITSQYGTFLDVMYIEDETAGITVFAPVSGLSSAELTPGTRVRVVGMAQLYEGDVEVEVTVPQGIQVIDEGEMPEPLALTVAEAASDAREGTYLRTAGEVVALLNDYTVRIADETGEATVFIPGALGSLDHVSVGDWVEVTGFGWDNYDGYDIRVQSSEDVAVTGGGSAEPFLGTGELELSLVARYDSGSGLDEGGSEIVAYDPVSQRAFSTNSDQDAVDILDMSQLGEGELPLIKRVKIADLNLAGFEPGGVTSVAVHPEGGYLAAAVPNDSKTDPGKVIFLDVDGNLLGSVTVGALPDMLTFTPDGTKVLVANEGEPNDDYTVDPEGSVSIINVSQGVENVTDEDVTTADFNGFSEENGNVDASVRIFGPDASADQDFEPEYISVTPDSAKAYISLQENNAIAELDINAGKLTQVNGLGFKDHSLGGKGIDASDKDDAIQIQPWPVLGMFLPDGIALYEKGSKRYLLTANEGDARDYDGFGEEARVKDILNPGKLGKQIHLDATHYAGFTQGDLDAMMADGLFDDDQLGRLNVTTTLGDENSDGTYEALYGYGGRSFSIWDVSDMQLVYDSGEDFERVTAAMFPENFNSNNDENSFDTRSDDKGPEPEYVTVGSVGEQDYAFVGLERMGGVMVYNITDPAQPELVTYYTSRDFTGDPEAGTAGDLGPEGLHFISAEESPTGASLLLVGNELSGTVSVYEVASEGEGQPGGPVSKISLQVPEMVTPGATFDMAIHVNDIEDLYGASVELSFDPDQLQVMDADPNVEGIQITLGDWLRGANIENEVDNETGTIRFTVTQLGEVPGVSGEGVLGTVTFQANEGLAADATVTITPVAGSVQMANSQNEPIEVELTPVELTVTEGLSVSGQVVVPGTHRLADLSDFTVKLFDGEGQEVDSTTTDEAGHYTLIAPATGEYQVSVERSGYLSAVTAVTVTETGAEVEAITAYVGDFNGDQQVDLEDIGLLAREFRRAVGAANQAYDVDADGDIDLFDVIAVARNFGKEGSELSESEAE